MAAHKKTLDPDKVIQLAAMGATTQEMAHFFDVSKDTIERNYMEEMEKGRSVRNLELRTQQMKLAKAGHCGMLIWLGKQCLGQRDVARLEHVGDPEAPMQITVREQVRKVMSDAALHKAAAEFYDQVNATGSHEATETREGKARPPVRLGRQTRPDISRN